MYVFIMWNEKWDESQLHFKFAFQILKQCREDGRS